MRATLTGVFFTTLMSSAARLPLAWPTDKESNTTCASALPPTASWSYRTTGTFAAAAAARLPAARVESAEAGRITLGVLNHHLGIRRLGLHGFHKEGRVAALETDRRGVRQQEEHLVLGLCVTGGRHHQGGECEGRNFCFHTCLRKCSIWLGTARPRFFKLLQTRPLELV